MSLLTSEQLKQAPECRCDLDGFLIQVIRSTNELWDNFVSEDDLIKQWNLRQSQLNYSGAILLEAEELESDLIRNLFNCSPRSFDKPTVMLIQSLHL